MEGSGYGSSRQEEQFISPASVSSLGISDEDLILMSTRDLNKFLKVKLLNILFKFKSSIKWHFI